MSSGRIKQVVFSCLVCLSAALGMSSVAQAGEIYKYRAPDGSYHFTDRPMSGGYKLLWHSGSGAKPRKSGGYSLAKMKENRTRLTPLIENVARELRLNPGLIHAMVQVESAYNPRALSKKGAQGLMQLMPATASRYGVENSYDPQQNLEGGARYLKDLLQAFEYDIRLALAAYNAGETTVKRYGNKVPPYPETISYVDKVLDEYERNRLAMAD